jgi:hypothetical protein
VRTIPSRLRLPAADWQVYSVSGAVLGARGDYYRTRKLPALRAMIRRWKPWKGRPGQSRRRVKERSAMRGYKGRQRAVLQELRRLLREIDASINAV